MIKNAIYKAFHKKQIKDTNKNGLWETPMYWAIDLHDVIIPGNYNRYNDKRVFYPNAKNVLIWLSLRKDMKLILFTSSHKDSIDDIMSWLQDNLIYFDYINENPECKNNELCSFDKKWYMDILLEDKAGFNGENDWYNIMNALQDVGVWQKYDSFYYDMSF